MNETVAQCLLLAAILWPLLNVLAFALPGAKSMAWKCSAFAALPGLLLALAGPIGTSVTLPQTSLTILNLDDTGRVFLGFTAMLWLLSGWYAIHCLRSETHRVRFEIFFLLSMTGNFLLILANDIPTFYAGFAMMGFASAGLVVHRGDGNAVRAGRIYLTLAAVGEILLFVGFGFLAASSSSLVITDVVRAESPPVAIVLLLVGFGIKAGALSVHFWLPLAHPTAPVPASAVLSGAMIKAGVFGWIRFLPLGLVEWSDLGLILIALGLLGAVLGTIAGITQRNPKTVLAYSSLSQVGIMLVGIGVAFVDRSAWPPLLSALLIYTAHHGLAKGALFLGVLPAKHVRSKTQVWLARVGLLLPALALAGAPFSSGAVAKLALKEPIRNLPGFYSLLVGVLLPLAATGTTLLMIRFLTLSWPSLAQRDNKNAVGLWVPWMLAVVSTLVVVWWLPGMIAQLDKVTSLEKIWASAWPILAGIGLAGIWHGVSKRFAIEAPRGLPAGDMVVFFERVLSRCFAPQASTQADPDSNRKHGGVRVDWARLLDLLESRMRQHMWLLLLPMLIALMILLMNRP